MKERKRLLVGVTSAAGYEDRRSRCRATWFGDLAADPHVLPFFVIGRPGGDSPVLVGDTLFLPCADDYDSLPQKTLGMIRWALDRWDFDYLFKCDDDTYVHPERLKLFPFEGRDYMGGGPGFASGGAGYFLSREAARAVARRGLPLTGAEDLLVGDVLRQAGFGLHLSDRFVPTKGRAAAPRPDNAVVTTHPILDDMLMATIHREAQATPTPAGFDGAFELLEAITGYGKVGLHGAQGCDVSGGPDALEHEQSPASWQAYCTVSAHAPSALRVRLHRPMSLFMFCDDQAFERPDDPLRFSLNGDPFWEWGRGPRRSPDFRLDPGDHTLAAAVRQNTRAYSAWALRPLGGDGMRIVMPTSNNYVEVAALCLELLERHWPGHPPVDVLHYDRRVPTELPVRQIRVGSQSEVSWIEGIRGYLSSKNSDELILLWLDDYAMCGGADVERVARARRCMASDLSLASFSLTWMMRPPCRPYPGAPDVQVCPCWEYSCHTQAGIWRRLSLLRVLTALSRGSAADFELAGSRYYNRCEAAFEHHAAFLLPDPPVPDLFLDRTDKRFWPLPYHNLMHAGAPDSRHDEFRRQIRA